MSNFLYVYKEVIGMLEAKKNGRRLKKNIFWYNYATWRFKKNGGPEANLYIQTSFDK